MAEQYQADPYKANADAYYTAHNTSTRVGYAAPNTSHPTQYYTSAHAAPPTQYVQQTLYSPHPNVCEVQGTRPESRPSQRPFVMQRTQFKQKQSPLIIGYMRGLVMDRDICLTYRQRAQICNQLPKLVNRLVQRNLVQTARINSKKELSLGFHTRRDFEELDKITSASSYFVLSDC